MNPAPTINLRPGDELPELINDAMEAGSTQLQWILASFRTRDKPH
ncbi:MAG: hypothetical protein R3E01_15715 [Pirellulaceae bacterium]